MNLSTTNWDKVKLGDILTLEYGKSLPEKERTPGNYKVFGSNGVVGYHEKALLHGPVIIVGRKGSVGSVRMTQDPCWPIDTTYWVKPKRALSTKWLFEYLCHAKLNRLNEASGVPGLNRENAYRLNMPFPPIAEQERIAEILSDADAAIATTEKIYSAIKEMLFATQTRLIFDEAFPREKLKSALKQNSERKSNIDCDVVLSVTNNAGFVLSEELFARRIASVDISNYKVVRNGQFAYNPARLNVGSIARLNKWKVGLVSPMYVVLETKKDKLLPDFFRHWLQTAAAKQRICQSVQGSVRLSVGFEDLCSIFIPLPRLEKQSTICKTLKEIEKEMGIYLNLIAALKKQKRGLMQQLLTGKIRVLPKNNKGGKK